ncbi:MAG: glycosyltransferase family 2 protein [Mucilaginibacter polytrichastri]|nr:glycosyltransferase family 2 protein [Mucilaginibacter polytrichastri]
METFLKVLFWFSLFIPAYNYFGYAVIVYLANKLFSPYKITGLEPNFEPEVTLLIAAYNEEDFIREKIENCLQLNYPKEKLRIAFVTDGSSDLTPDIARSYPQVEVHHEPERRGKAMAINRVMELITSPIVIFCDANTELNPDAVRLIVSHYSDPEVGGVSGEKKINPRYATDSAGAGEGLYWKYESFLKKIDSEFYSVVGAAGELFSVRKNLYDPVEPDTILDDFMISLRINKKGYRIIYEPNAFAMEDPSANIAEESKRKTRIAAGGFQSIFRLLPLLNIFRYGRLSFLYTSHRVLRWLVTPFALALLIITNVLLLGNYVPFSSVYGMIFWGQVLFYAGVVLGWINARRKGKIPVVNALYYFAFMNISVYSGLAKYLGGRQSAMWQRSERLRK